jgi:hypothetical protein
MRVLVSGVISYSPICAITSTATPLLLGGLYKLWSPLLRNSVPHMVSVLIQMLPTAL